MTTETQTTEAAATPKPKTVLEDMDARKLFDSVEDAGNYLAKCAEDFTDFNSYPHVPVGFTDEGEFDLDVYNDSMQIAVAKVTEKGSQKDGRESKVRMIVIYPSPKPAAVIADPACADWLATIIAKEANLVAMRPIRKAGTEDELADAVQQMPTTIGEYIASGRESSGGILESYNDLWQIIKKAIGEKFKSFALANLSKKELRKAMESASYAAAIYPHLETRTNKAGEPDSHFVRAVKLGLALAKQEGKDSTWFERTLGNRDNNDIAVVSDEGEEDFDFEAVAAKLTAKPAETDETQGDNEPGEPGEEGASE